jgi:polyphosphate glucokinase
VLGFGVDIGGTGMKGAIVDLGTGELTSERFRLDTPQPATPDAVADVLAEIVAHHQWSGPFGATIPSVVKKGIVYSAANIDDAWIGLNADKLFEERSGLDVHIINDADAAGLAEARYGAAREEQGVVLLLTFGTGIGSALLYRGVLVPNSEMGHLEFEGDDAEKLASAKARKRNGLTMEEWADVVNRYLDRMMTLLSPDLIVFGGGISKRWADFGHMIDTYAPVVPATFRNNAGIIGAAISCVEAGEE